MGMTDRQLLFQVELPLALGVIIAGVRVATVISVGLATIAAAIGAGGLGEFIFRGLAMVSNQLILVGAAEIPTRCQQIFPCCPTWTIEGEASRRGNHCRMQCYNAPFATHSTRKIQILEKIKISKTAEFFENVSANEDSLITEKPSAQPCANAGEHTCAAQKRGGRIITSRKTAPNDIPLCNYRFDFCKSILRQSRIQIR